MRHSKLAGAALVAGAAFALSACGGGDGEASNTAMNALEAGFGNAADPSAVETMGNGSEAMDLGNDGNAGGADNRSCNEAAVGNAAGGTSNGM